MQSAGKIKDEMFADGNDLLDRAAGDALLIVDASEMRQYGVESLHRFSGERRVQCACGAKDRVAFRHGADIPSMSG